MNSRLVLGLSLVGVGILALVVRSLSYLDAPPPAFRASDFVSVRREALATTQPKSNDWPVIVARELLVQSPRSPEVYELRVGTARESTCLIRFNIKGESPERTTAFASWLADASARSLRQSLTPMATFLDEPSAQAWGEAQQYSSSISGRYFTAILDVLPSGLLVAAGVVIYRLRCHRIAEPGASPNGGPATLPGNSEATEGPPSVS